MNIAILSSQCLSSHGNHALIHLIVCMCVCVNVCVFRLIQRTGNGQANIKSGFRNRKALATKADGLTVGRMNKKSV